MNGTRASAPTVDARDTRAKLLAAARSEFCESGYHGTDTNRIARAASLAPATFYRHFSDKAAIFLAVYDAWVTEDWARSRQVIARGKSVPQVARAILRSTLEFYRESRGIRASVRALLYREAPLRAACLEQGKRQLQIVMERRAARGLPALPPEEHFAVLCLVERVIEAIALDDVKEMGLDERRLLAVLERVLEAYLQGHALSAPRDPGR